MNEENLCSTALLANCFFKMFVDEIVESEKQAIEVCEEDLHKLEYLLDDANKENVVRFEYSIINQMELVEIEYIKKAIQFGLRVGFEAKESLSLFEC